MSEESDDSDSSDSSDYSSRQKMFTAAGMVLCVIQFAFFVAMILMFMETDFAQGFKFMLLAYSSAFIYKNMENSGIIQHITRNWWQCGFKIHTFYISILSCFIVFLFFTFPFLISFLLSRSYLLFKFLHIHVLLLSVSSTFNCQFKSLFWTLQIPWKRVEFLIISQMFGRD